MSYQIKGTTDPAAVVILLPRNNGANVSLVRDGRRAESLGYFCSSLLPRLLPLALACYGLALA